jgi:hypothetical protein
MLIPSSSTVSLDAGVSLPDFRHAVLHRNHSGDIPDATLATIECIASV